MTNYGTNANMTAGEVKERLASYQDSGITDELSGFGSVLLADAISRISTIVVLPSNLDSQGLVF